MAHSERRSTMTATVPGTAEPADDPAPTREREVISAFAEITREAITDTRLEDLLTWSGDSCANCWA